MKKLICFDFDGTLFDTPHPESGKQIWEQKTGRTWRNGWWANPESLNLQYFDPQLRIQRRGFFWQLVVWKDLGQMFKQFSINTI